MIVTCSTCHRRFDDEYRTTICPHQTFAANDGGNNFAHHHDSFLSANAEQPQPATTAEKSANNIDSKVERTKVLGTVGYLGAVPALPPHFVWSLVQMVQWNQEALCQPGERIDYQCAGVLSLHDAARNQLAREFKGDWLLQFDADILFDPEVAGRLLTIANRWNVDVLCGMYSYKTRPHLPIAYLWNERLQVYEPIQTWDRDMEIFQIGAAGGGCLWVRRRVFDRIANELKELPFARIGSKGEDLSFFDRLRKLGIPAYCAWKVQMGHLKWDAVIPDEHYGEVPPGGLLVRPNQVPVFGKQEQALQ